MDNPSPKEEGGKTTSLPSLKKQLLGWIILGNPTRVCVAVLCLPWKVAW